MCLSAYFREEELVTKIWEEAKSKHDFNIVADNATTSSEAFYIYHDLSGYSSSVSTIVNI